MYFRFFLFFILGLGPALAVEYKVEKLHGTVKWKGKVVSSMATFEPPGLIETGEKSLVKLTYADQSLVIGPGSQVELEGGENEQSVKFTAGVSRWFRDNTKSPEQVKFKTKNAAMGVRGTDFLIVYSPLLDETEVVIFEGRINFQSQKNLKNQRDFKAGQWGGLGGRFGQKVTSPIDLPSNVLEHFAKSLPR